MTDIVIDLGGVTDRPGLMDRFADGLNLPDWFGRNWDALADVLRDVPEGRRVVVRSWRAYAKARPEEWEIAFDVLQEADLPAVLAL